MKLAMFAVRDRAAQFYFPPFFVRTTVEAVRMFERLMNDSGRSGAYSDYDLSHIADFDDQTGRLDVLEVPAVVSNGSDFRPSSAEVIPNV